MGFDAAYQLVKANEGGYADNPNDRGGETMAGIARNYWPNWTGWLEVDRIKLKYPTNYVKYLNSSQSIRNAVRQFFKRYYWDRFHLDKMQNQSIAATLFDFIINAQSNGAKVFQRTLNRFLSTPVAVDGVVGPKTVAATNSLNSRAQRNLFEAFQQARATYYRSLSQFPIFGNAWLNRLKKFTYSESSAPAGGNGGGGAGIVAAFVVIAGATIIYNSVS